jgi:hypothetical protein
MTTDGGEPGQRTGADDSGEPELKYTQEQYQAGMDAIIARERGKLERETARQAKTFHAEWLKTNGVSEEEALDLFAKREVVLASAEEAQTELVKLKRQFATVETERDAALSERDRYQGLHRGKLVNDAVMTAAVSGNARHPDQVIKLVSDRVRLNEDDQVEVLDEHGEPAHGVTVDQMVHGYLAEYPNLVKSSAGEGGSGGRPTSGAQGSSNGEANWATPEGKRAGLRALFGAEE